MPYERRKKRGIHHVCLRVPDLYKTVEFYKNALDAEVICEWGTDENEDHAFILDLGTGDFLEIFGSSQHFEDVGRWQHVAVWTDDLEGDFQRALDCGATVDSKPARYTIPTRDGLGARMGCAFVKAPGGEIVEFNEIFE